MVNGEIELQNVKVCLLFIEGKLGLRLNGEKTIS